MQANGLLVPGVGNRFNGLVIGGDGIPEDQQGRVGAAVEAATTARIPFGAPRGLYDAQNLFMPRLSFAYSLNAATVIRGGVGLFYDKPEGNVIFSQLNIPPVLANEHVRELQHRGAGRRRGRRDRRGRRHQRLDPGMQMPRQINFSIGVQRELGSGYFVEATYVGNRGKLPDPPAGRQPRQLRRAAGQRRAAVGAAGLDQLPAALQGLLGDPHAHQRRRARSTTRCSSTPPSAAATSSSRCRTRSARRIDQRQRQRRQRRRRRRSATSPTSTVRPRSTGVTPSSTR